MTLRTSEIRIKEERGTSGRIRSEMLQEGWDRWKQAGHRGTVGSRILGSDQVG